LSNDLVITKGDSAEFSELSLDFNPIHLDPIVARRSLFGATICHGVHILLKALEFIFCDRKKAITISKIKVVFRTPILTGQFFQVEYTEVIGRNLKINVFCKSIKSLTISLYLHDTITQFDNEFLITKGAHRSRELSFNQAAKVNGTLTLTFDKKKFKRLFPSLSKSISNIQAAEILSTTQVVGMKTPGYHSIFSQMNLTFNLKPTDLRHELRYQVTNSREDLSFIEISINGPSVEGTLIALYRPRPVEQASYAEIQTHIISKKFTKLHALIIGGSRGLGEVTAKIIAAGGGKSTITYSVGKSEAMEIQKEIEAGGGECDIHQLTVDKNTLIPRDFPKFNQLYFFATPKILKKRGTNFDQDLFNKYHDIYKQGFETICQSIILRKQRTAVLFPSTTLIEDPAPEFLEYVMAKKEGEAVCKYLDHSEYLKIIHPRLPKIKTDQTGALTKNKSYNAVDNILPLVRSLDKNDARS